MSGCVHQQCKHIVNAACSTNKQEEFPVAMREGEEKRLYLMLVNHRMNNWDCRDTGLTQDAHYSPHFKHTEKRRLHSLMWNSPVFPTPVMYNQFLPQVLQKQPAVNRFLFFLLWLSSHLQAFPLMHLRVLQQTTVHFTMTPPSHTRLASVGKLTLGEAKWLPRLLALMALIVRQQFFPLKLLIPV